MEHSEAKDLFSDYLEGELDAQASAALEEHLSSCPKCKQEFESFRRTIQAVSGLKPLQAPQDFASKVNHRLRRRLRTRRKPTSPWSYKLPFETICLVMLIILAAFYIMLYLLPQIVGDTEFRPVPRDAPPREKRIPRTNGSRRNEETNARQKG